MKNLTILLLAAALLSAMIACESENKEVQETSITEPEQQLDLNANRGNAAEHIAIDRFSMDGINIDIEELETILIQQAQAEGTDATVTMKLNRAYNMAEKQAQMLDVNFSMSEEPVANGMFVFSIESQDNKDLTLELYDEEGYGLAANNTFSVNEGNNYKALNVSSLEDGEYLFRLKDENGRELARTVQIDAVETETYQ